MKTVLRNRYYCDHCKKAGGSASHMRKHEAGCTNNPQRVCGMCKHGTGHIHSVADLVAILGRGSDAQMKELREATGDCPACILAAIRQSSAAAYLLPENNDVANFDFKKEAAGFWIDHTRNKHAEGYY